MGLFTTKALPANQLVAHYAGSCSAVLLTITMDTLQCHYADSARYLRS